MLEVAHFIMYNTLFHVSVGYLSICLAVAFNKFPKTKIRWTITVYVRSVLVVGTFRYNSSCRQRFTFILSFKFEELMFNLPQLPVFV